MKRSTAAAVALFMWIIPALAQAQTEPHQHPAPAEPAAPTPWHFMQDGVAWLTYNNQGGPRGGEDFGSQNWWMGMLSRPAAGGTFQFNLMLSLDALTLGNDGYREIFQVGETLNGVPLIDRQHPHDFLMQASVGWKHAIGRGFSLTLAGAPVGDPALGPVAFMHRASAAENPTAPLAHHTFDSTHIAMGVLTAAVDRRSIPGRVLDFPGTRARRAALGPGRLRPARLVVGPGMVSPQQPMGLPTLARLSDETGATRGRQRAPDNSVRVVDAPALTRNDSDDGCVRT